MMILARPIWARDFSVNNIRWETGPGYTTRTIIGKEDFIEIFINTPIEECEKRDVKGLYAKARRGELKGFTGIDDPYEEPLNAEIVLDTVSITPEENARAIIAYLKEQGFIQ